VALALSLAGAGKQPFQARQGQLTVGVVCDLGSRGAKRDNQGQFGDHGDEIVNFRLLGKCAAYFTP
jgi:lipoprotein-releasing system permease protein